jgi:hypothetical protein
MSFSSSAIAARIHSDATRIKLPIVSIHGFPVSAAFILKNIRTNTDGVYFEIAATTVGKQSHKFYSAFLCMADSPEKTETYIQAAYETIRYFVFDKLTGQFIDSRLPKPPVPLVPELEDIPFVRLSHQPCPGCSEYTKTKTACDHPLCLDCWRKIPIEAAYCYTAHDMVEYHPCPTCSRPCMLLNSVCHS